MDVINISAPAVVGRPPCVFCIGLPGSASTWILNVVLQLLSKDGGGPAPVPIYVDESNAPLPDQPDAVAMLSVVAQANREALEATGCLVIKSHVPGPLMLRLAGVTRSPLLVSVRDPRDAVCSLMKRFGQDFATALASVAVSANVLAKLKAPTLLLRYEDGFSGSAETVRMLAAALGVPCGETECADIIARFSLDEVALQVARLEEVGTFDPARSPAEQFDPRTLWHPNHVGDGRSGKWREMITSADNAVTVWKVRAFLDRFGYPLDLAAVAAGDNVRFNAGAEGVGWLFSGFADPEPWGTWSCAPRAVLRFVLTAPVMASVSMHLECVISPSLQLQVGSAVAVSLNGQHLLRIMPQGAANVMRIALWREGRGVVGFDYMELAFDFEGIQSPRDMGISGDERLIGLGLVALEVNWE